MEINLCKALLINDRAGLQVAVDDFLEKIDTKADQKKNFEAIKSWLLSQECVDTVVYTSELLETEPPIKEFIVNVKGSENLIYLGISLRADRWKFNRK